MYWEGAVDGGKQRKQLGGMVAQSVEVGSDKEAEMGRGSRRIWSR
jgi:hypothetical protein